MPNVKFVGMSAAAAFLLSLLAGVIGGVGFFTILFRAVAGAVVFGLLAGGIYILLERMIPELFELEGQGEYESEESAQTGGSVDITLGEDEEPAPSQPTRAEDASAAAEAEDGTDRAVSGASPDFGETPEFAAAQEDDSSDEGFIEELDEGEPAPGGSGGTAGEEEKHGEQQPASVHTEEGTESGSGGGAEASEARPAAASSNEETDFADAENVDTLPDLEDFADSFEGVAASQEEGGGGEMGSYTGGGSSSSNVDVMGDHHDSETVAKAVRTLMKKDQEG
jgi:hypothetical protein